MRSGELVFVDLTGLPLTYADHVALSGTPDRSAVPGRIEIFIDDRVLVTLETASLLRRSLWVSSSRVTPRTSTNDPA